MTRFGIQLALPIDAVPAAGSSVARQRWRRKDDEPVDTSPRVCKCDGQLVDLDEDGDEICCACGRRKP